MTEPFKISMTNIGSAMQYTIDNVDNIKDWLGEHRVQGNFLTMFGDRAETIDVESSIGWVIVKPNDYIVTILDGVYVWDPKAFAEQFEVV